MYTFQHAIQCKESVSHGKVNYYLFGVCGAADRRIYFSLAMVVVGCVWNVMAHAQKPDFVFLRNRRVHLNQQGLQFSRLLAAELCASAVVILDTPCSEVVWMVLAAHSIRQFPLQFPFRASPCAITFQLDFTMTMEEKRGEGDEMSVLYIYR